jgi:hypothetical protein
MDPLPNPPAEPEPAPQIVEPPHTPGQVIGPNATTGDGLITPQMQPTAPDSQDPVVGPTLPEQNELSVSGEANERPMAVVFPGQGTNSVINGQIIGQNDAGKSPLKRMGRRSMLIMLLVPLLLLGGSAAAYFGYVLPNKPANIWAKALINTGKGYDKLASYSESQLSGKTKGVTIKGSYKVSGSIAADGTFEGSSDADNGEFTASLSATGVKVNLDTRIIKSAAGSPDIYFKLDGLQGIGTLFGGAGSQYENALNGINGNWYFVDHTLFDQYAKGANSSLQISQSDVHSVLKAIGDASKQNVFTSDTSKMAFTVKQNVGKENQDGRSVYHFKAAINKDNLKTYVKNLCTNLEASNLKKFFNNDSKQVGSTLGCDTADTAIANFKDGRTADVWVDMHTKLIHKVRFIDPNNKDNYFDVGQDYQGGDVLPFSLGFHSKDSGLTSDGTISLSLNMKTNSLIVKGSARDSGTDSTSGSIDFTVSPNSSKVKVDKPANAKTLIQLLNDVGFGDFFGAGGSSTSAADTTRRTDLNILATQAEVYYTDSGYYPSLTQFNDPTWRATNMKGFDGTALKDPAGTVSKLGAAPAAHIYSYQALPAGCDNVKVNCTDYTLTATLDDGSTYVKQALSADTGPPTVLN